MNARHDLQAQATEVRSAFAAVVRRHLATMPADEWERLRAFGSQRHRFVERKSEPMPELTRDQLVDHCISVDACPLEDILNPVFRAAAIEIGTIDGREILYVAGEGIYLWPESGVTTRMLWVTHPAYPPSW